MFVTAPIIMEMMILPHCQLVVNLSLTWTCIREHFPVRYHGVAAILQSLASY